MKPRSAALLLVAALVAVAHADRPGMEVQATFNVTPDPSWATGERVTLSIDARRNDAIGQEDIFFRQAFSGTFPRTAGQTFEVVIPKVKPHETIILQGYMCSADSGDCYPSDKDNPPSCSVRVTVQPPFKASCRPSFTWSGGSAAGGVLCSTSCN